MKQAHTDNQQAHTDNQQTSHPNRIRPTHNY